MRGLLFAAVAAVAVALLVAAPSVQAHGGGVVVSRGGVIVRSGGFHGGDVVVARNGAVVVRGGGVVVRGGNFNNRSFFNQDGGRNRFGFRR